MRQGSASWEFVCVSQDSPRALSKDMLVPYVWVITAQPYRNCKYFCTAHPQSRIFLPTRTPPKGILQPPRRLVHSTMHSGLVPYWCNTGTGTLAGMLVGLQCTLVHDLRRCSNAPKVSSAYGTVSCQRMGQLQRHRATPLTAIPAPPRNPPESARLCTLFGKFVNYMRGDSAQVRYAL